MQINLSWTCRECGASNGLVTDSSACMGFIPSPERVEEMVAEGVLRTLSLMSVQLTGDPPLELSCHNCDHVSAQIGLLYRYGEEHTPTDEDWRWEIERPRGRARPPSTKLGPTSARGWKYSASRGAGRGRQAPSWPPRS